MNVTKDIYLEKEDSYIFPIVNLDKKESIEQLLLHLYRENSSIFIFYRQRGKIRYLLGRIERIDFIDKELFLNTKKKISFQRIVRIKEKRNS